ncbi:hypothetical protein AURANDRAFT_67270 [Aureococcus anophagefferens]|uniref:Uncharacterized protein n=1 Tax=Aureococcus anophagefferens TaxID=44056 RepID=F0YKL4_AURAN|nr:hypothetical protein AURANDRAFT_67270 [Aureococcus anophagefferens]EGB04375.1 hypothetical protein AURANDRAFT_67270 [Aureococcus anophagefferens]|eukprot:XP_009040932.1 hypothetical protein AURANDRAFT_67270 [Aureococcus anophagefferens]
MEDPTRQARRTTRHTGTGVGATSTCPICGLSFPTNRIAEHADRCAASTYVDELEATTGRGRAPPGGGLGARAASGRGAARAGRRGTGEEGGNEYAPFLDYGAAGRAPPTKRAAPRPAPRPRGAAAPAAPRAAAPRAQRAPAEPPRSDDAPRRGGAPLAHGKTWRVPGGEAARLRGGSVIYAAELPPHVLERVARAESVLASLRPEACSFTTGKGTLDRKRTNEYRRRVQEEEYQLELYRSTLGAPAPPRPPPPETRDARAERRSAADDAPPPPPPEPHQPKLLLRVHVGDDGRAAAVAAPSNKEALEYVARMRSVHKLSPRTIATFVELLKAYKRKVFSAADVSRRIATLLHGYPDLIKDFDNFLPVHDAPDGAAPAPPAPPAADADRAAAARRAAAAAAPPPEPRESDYTRAWRDRAGGAAPRLDLLAFAPAAAPPAAAPPAAAPPAAAPPPPPRAAAPPPAADAARAAQYRQLQAYQLQQEHTRQLLERQRQLAGPAPPFVDPAAAHDAWRGAWVDYNGTLARLQAAGAPAADAGVREVVAAASRVIAAARTIAALAPRAAPLAGGAPPPANNVGAPAMSAVAAANTIAALTCAAPPGAAPPPPAAARPAAPPAPPPPPPPAAAPPPRPDAAELLRRQRELLAARYGVGPRAAPRAADDPRFFHGGTGESSDLDAYSDSDGDASNHAPAPAPGDGDASDDDDDDDALDVARGAGDAAADDTGAKRATLDALVASLASRAAARAARDAAVRRRPSLRAAAGAMAAATGRSLDEVADAGRAPESVAELLGAGPLRTKRRRAAVRTDYARMRALVYEVWDRAAKECDIPNFGGSYLGWFPLVWDRYADDAETFDAFAAAVLGACDGGGPPPQSFDAMVERLRAVFRGEADDIVEAIVDARPGAAPRAPPDGSAAEPPLDDDGAPRVEFLGERRKRFRGMPPPGAPGAAAPAPALEAALEAA